MPRQARLDTPAAFHHVIIRGIERRAIFWDDKDREDFIDRLTVLLPATKTVCYAWAFLPNHAHFLFRSGPRGLAFLMRRLLTGYAVRFNLRYHRHGPLFQNRYKSILCQEDLYLKELVRYIHLNPFRARVVSDLKEMDVFPYCGHSALIGKLNRPWQDIEYVLLAFGRDLREGRAGYAGYIEAGANQGRRDELVGGGLIRSLGGWAEVKSARAKPAGRTKGDERILGESDFVLEVLAEANEALDQRFRLKTLGYDLEKVAERVSNLFGIEIKEVLSRGRQRNRVEARSLLCYWAVRELGMTGTDLARAFRMAPSAVSYAVKRGEALAEIKRYRLIE